jgi:hypothetical protein
MVRKYEEPSHAWDAATWPRGLGPSRSTSAWDGAAIWVGIRSVTPCVLASGVPGGLSMLSGSCRHLGRLPDHGSLKPPGSWMPKHRTPARARVGTVDQVRGGGGGGRRLDSSIALMMPTEFPSGSSTMA